MLERLPGRAFHYRDAGSALHRLSAGGKASIVCVASGAALAADTWPELCALALLVAAGYRAARLSVAELWQDARWPLLQGLVLVALAAARYGAEGLGLGARAGVQIALFFLPGALLLRTTPALALVESLRRVLPARLTFAIGASLRFIPYFARELHDVVGAQRLRGARLAARDLWRPVAWRDWVGCVGVPLAVRAIHTANQAALAAEIRGIAAGEDRP
jgi:energy-coupling factor transport system permease protein